MDKFTGKKIAITGFGIEGQSIVDFLLPMAGSIVVLDEKNAADFDQKQVEIYLRRGVEFRWGKIANLMGFDIVFRSPGVNLEADFLKDARQNGAEITSSTKEFFNMCSCGIIGVTGTKGKGTTSTLIYEMLKKEGFDAYLGGNIGVPPLSFLSQLKQDSKVVLELSSFQLQDLTKSPHIAVMLMVTSEHLEGFGNQNFHTTVEEYVEAKRNILRYQTDKDFAIINQDYPASNESDISGEGQIYKVSRERDVFEQGCFIKDGKIILKMHGREEEIFDTKDLALRGKHNWENVMAALVAATIAGVSMKSIDPVLRTFKGLEHRIEFVATKKGVSYFDDSFSTTPETAIAAIEAFSEPKILILGGSSKKSDFSELGQVISDSNSIKAIIGIGVEWSQIKSKIRNGESRIKVYEDCKNMHEVVQKCFEIGEIGDVVLLSPACASFGMFKSYKDRGEQFKKEVAKL